MSARWWTGVDVIDQGIPDGVCRGDVIEVFGASLCGKTEILYQLCLKAVLPRDMGGSDKRVIWIDADHKFDSERLCRVLIGRIEASRVLAGESAPLEANAVEGLLNLCLERIFVLRPVDMSEFLVGLRSLADLVAFHSDCLLLLLDSVSSWFWQVRFLEEDEGDVLERDMTRFVRELADKSGLIVFATRQMLFGPSAASKTETLPQYQDYSGRAWQELVRGYVTLAWDPRQEGLGLARFSTNATWRGLDRDDCRPVRKYTTNFVIDQFSGIQFGAFRSEDTEQ